MTSSRMVVLRGKSPPVIDTRIETHPFCIVHIDRLWGTRIGHRFPFPTASSLFHEGCVVFLSPFLRAVKMLVPFISLSV
jgi:hypothetical protein